MLRLGVISKRDCLSTLHNRQDGSLWQGQQPRHRRQAGLTDHRETSQWTIPHGQGRKGQFAHLLPPAHSLAGTAVPTCAAVKGELCGGVKLLDQELGQRYPLICF